MWRDRWSKHGIYLTCIKVPLLVEADKLPRRINAGAFTAPAVMLCILGCAASFTKQLEAVIVRLCTLETNIVFFARTQNVYFTCHNKRKQRKKSE